MSTRTESTVMAITVPSRPFPASSGLRDLLCSNWERMSLNDSLGSLIGRDSGLPGLDMKGHILTEGVVRNRITPCYPPLRRSRKRFQAVQSGLPSLADKHSRWRRGAADPG